MTCSYCPLFLYSLMSVLGIIATLPPAQNANAAVPSCPTPALSRIQRYQVTSGETLESIAERYNLQPKTIAGMNPSVNNRILTAGTQLQIPPFDGIVVQVPNGQTWRQVATKYKVRQDTLFEINGCQENPRVVFVPVVPGVTGTPNRIITASPGQTPPSETTFGYPLPNNTTIALPYGWQIEQPSGKVFFHSGVDLVAPVGTTVQAIAPGIVVFAKDQTSYGKLVIINHAGGLQTRYAQLDSIQVTLGQRVKQGDILGTVGTTGQPTSQEPHLHFEIRANEALGWTAKNPKEYLK
ncbi:M23 family metallopeptidase [Sphaerospermopsis aphanizomenoides BCCUSP55]|uniref:LysM peptidoglycan-binding domain-containing M23 family metallopeptidase n=1 Tax=Sphaerospermopsis aphanizomenoides TaxID=459663 RepID=UPI000B260512|nr:M23 family metallopeptidase [Sphaerospermopsis aphanizomenoides]MBK1988935.1 M23 family metallopeptidase [Sphaerospermopsis aphanizomenoides BCCUSP55]